MAAILNVNSTYVLPICGKFMIFLPYGIWVGRCVYDWLCCPICMDDFDSFRLENSIKVTFFDCHRMFIPFNHPFRNSSSSNSKGKKCDLLSSKSWLYTIASLFYILVSFHFYLHVFDCFHYTSLFVTFYSCFHLQDTTTSRKRHEQLLGCM
jgi:hypothetical protein